jgi:hypothetical protein
MWPDVTLTNEPRPSIRSLQAYCNPFQCPNFVTGLPQTQKGNDSIWVIIDRLTKVAHFILLKTTFGGATLAWIYLKEIVKLHGIPRKIVLHRGTQFTSKF